MNFKKQLGTFIFSRLKHYAPNYIFNIYLAAYISHFHPIPFEYGKSSNLTRCRLSDDLWAAKKDEVQGGRPKPSSYANALLQKFPVPTPPLETVHMCRLLEFSTTAIVWPLSLGRTKRRQHQNQAAVSWPPPLSLYNQPHRRLTHTQAHSQEQELPG